MTSEEKLSSIDEVLKYPGNKMGGWLKNNFILQLLLTQELASLNF